MASGSSRLALRIAWLPGSRYSADLLDLVVEYSTTNKTHEDRRNACSFRPHCQVSQLDVLIWIIVG